MLFNFRHALYLIKRRERLLIFDHGIAVAACHPSRAWRFRPVQAADDFREIVYVAVAAGMIERFVALDLDVAVILHARSGWNQTTHDDVLLQAAQVIYAS